MQPQRRSYSKSFKAQVIHECSQPGVPHPRGTVKVNWPTESAAACATFLRDLLR